MEKVSFISHSNEDTERWARDFAETLKRGSTVAFFGNLGAGKTESIRSICRALGFKGIVSSPTYTIVHEYPNNIPIFHLDLYRLGENADLEEIGFSRLLESNGIIFIEWAERLSSLCDITHTVSIEILNESSRKFDVQKIERAI